MVEVEKKKAGLRKIPIDWDVVDRLLYAGCLADEIAAHFGAKAAWLYNRTKEDKNVNYQEYSTEKKMTGDAMLKEAQFKKAVLGDNTMLIWLGKQRLGQRDNPQDMEALSSAAKEATLAAAAVHAQLQAYIKGKGGIVLEVVPIAIADQSGSKVSSSNQDASA